MHYSVELASVSVFNMRGFISHGIVFCFFSLCAFYVTYPLLYHLGDRATGMGDELLIAWIHGWVQHQILHNPLQLFDANIYYPFINSLAYSDAFITTSLLTFPLSLLLKEPIVAVNATLISSLVLLGMSVYLLTYFFVKDMVYSALAGLLIIFSPVVLDKYVHIQMLAIYFVPLSILSFFSFLKTRKERYLILSMILFILQTYNSFMPGYFIVFAIGITTILYLFKNKPLFLITFTKRRMVIIGLAFLALIPVAIPYYQVSREYNYTRDIRDTIHFALQPEDLLITNQFSRLSGILNQELFPYTLPEKNVEIKPGFIGAVFSILVLLSTIFIFRRWKVLSHALQATVLTAAFGLTLSFGPFLHLGRMTIHEPFPIPLPYLFFYYVAPGFQGFRNSARFEMLFVILASVIVVFVLYQILKRKRLVVQYLTVGVLCLLVILEYHGPIHFQQIPQRKEFPKVYEWLKTTPKEAVIIEIPVFTWDIQPAVFKENMREYYATVDFRKRVNGASGYSPEEWQNMVKRQLVTFPDESSIAELKAIGVNYIIVHTTDYDEVANDRVTVHGVSLKNGDRIIKELEKKDTLMLVEKIHSDYVYKIK